MEKNKNIMPIREFLDMMIDIDVYDNIEERVGIAFCGPIELTDYGKKYFAPVMDYKVDIYWGINEAVIDVGNEDNLDLLVELFHGAAGYISDKRWHELFKEVAS